MGKSLYDGRQISERSRVKLVFAGQNEEQPYYEELLKLAKSLNVTVVDVSKQIGFDRSDADGIKHYSLWDAYKLADFVSYPSLLEGFGNQLLETVYARKPFLIYEYPVFESYIKSFGLMAVSFGNRHRLDGTGLAATETSILETAAEESMNILTDVEQ